MTDLALSSPGVAVALIIVVAIAMYGVGILLWAAWSLFWLAFDHAMERWTRRRNGYRKCIHLVAPHHSVGRDAFTDRRGIWK